MCPLDLVYPGGGDSPFSRIFEIHTDIGHIQFDSVLTEGVLVSVINLFHVLNRRGDFNPVLVSRLTDARVDTSNDPVPLPQCVRYPFR